MNKLINRLGCLGWFVVFLIVCAGSIAVVENVGAWDCRRYNFRVTASGDAQVENRSGSDEPAQQADVYIPADHYSGTVDVPAMPADTGWTTFLNVVPPSGDWSWRVVGSKDCEDEGEHKGPTATPPPLTDTPKPSDTPTVIPSDTPKPSSTPVTPTHTVEPSDTPTDNPTDTPPPPTETRPPPTEPPEPSDTPKPKTPTPTQKVKTPVPTPTATVKVKTPTPSPTATPTSTESCLCYATDCCCNCVQVCCAGEVERPLFEGTELVPLCTLVKGIHYPGCPDDPDFVLQLDPDTESHLWSMFDAISASIGQDTVHTVTALQAIERDLNALQTIEQDLDDLKIVILVSGAFMGLGLVAVGYAVFTKNR